MTEKELKLKLQAAFDLTNWLEIFAFIFGNAEYFSQASLFSEDHEKVVAAKHLGVLSLKDNKHLAIFVVEVADNINIARNRQGLREIAIKHIDQNITHGALVFFYNKNQADYRFSFIAKEAKLHPETGEFINEETKPKRYTYLLGENEACTTAAKRLMILAEKRNEGKLTLQAFKEAFSVEALNKDFFKAYKEHYEKFWQYLADDNNSFREKLIDSDKKDKDMQEKPIRDFVKKLLGRIVFLQFLEKKGWLGVPLKNATESNNDKWSGGHPDFINQLFSNFSKADKFHSKCLTKLFFETLNTRRENDIFSLKGLNGELNGTRIPYLNGGLFEAESNKATLEVDFPANFFKNLLEFFNHYNFTIDENRPDDHEVGIDPEMLGHIFENLLEDNRDRGAFYTPKEIVQYMCQESLIQYLLNSFDAQKDIEDFIRQHKVSEFLAQKENAQKLDEKLDELKICDPAIGSGAFPIGMLQEIFEAKRYIYPHLNTAKTFAPTKVKRDIIQNSIYGVDIEKGAVDIAQLRFWLNLVVDEEIPSPLPNLDYKIMQGNSLLESFEGIDLNVVSDKQKSTEANLQGLFGNISENQFNYTFFDKKYICEIQKLIHQFYDLETSNEKQNIRNKINQLVAEHLFHNIELREEFLREHISYTPNPDAIQKKDARNRYNNLLLSLKKIEESKDSLYKIQNKEEKPYFLWKLYFQDVFEKGGFDIVIGNPPYIQLQKDGGLLADLYRNANFETFSRTGDIYCLFYEKGIKLLKDNGVLTYITSNKWMRAGYGKKTRAFFCKYKPLKLIDLGSNIFETATVDTNIFIIKKQLRTLENCSVAALDLTKEKNISDFNKYEKQWLETSNLTDESWTISSAIEQKIKNKIESKGLALKNWDIQIYRGILTGFNEAFIIDEATKKQLIAEDPKNAEIIKPILRGRDIKRYQAEFANLWLINSHNGVKGKFAPVNIKKDYPAIYNHLAKYKERLQVRHDKGEHWTNLRNCAYLEEFEKEKIVYNDICQKLTFSLVGQNVLFNNTAYFLNTNSYYLLGLLNSKLIDWLYKKTSVQLGDKSVRMFSIYVQELPLPQLSQLEQEPFIALVKQILALKSAAEDTSHIEQKIDVLIYHLYDLDYDEVLIIDEKFPLTREEYNKQKIVT